MNKESTKELHKQSGSRRRFSAKKADSYAQKAQCWDTDDPPPIQNCIRITILSTQSSSYLKGQHMNSWMAGGIKMFYLVSFKTL